MKTAADEGDVFADYDFIYGENATGFIVNFTEMEEICPDMTDEDRALLKGPTRILSGYRSNSECTQTFLVTKVRYDSCTESSCFCVLCATIKGPNPWIRGYTGNVFVQNFLFIIHPLAKMIVMKTTLLRCRGSNSIDCAASLVVGRRSSSVPDGRSWLLGKHQLLRHTLFER